MGSKRSYTSILENVEYEHGEDAMRELQLDIKDIIMKTVCMIVPHVTHLKISCQPEDIENS